MIGYDFFKFDNFPLRKIHQAIIPLAMPHIAPQFTLQQSRLLLKKNHAFLFRWDEKFDEYDEGEWWHVIKDEPEDILNLAKKTRYMIRSGKKYYEARPCDREYIISHGYSVYIASFERYDTFERCFTETEFKSGISSLPECTEFWGVFDINTNQLTAFSENLVRDKACFYSTMWLDPKAMKKFAGYVLFHEMNKHYLNDEKLKYVSDGARSISHQTNIHQFLQSKFGFRKAYSKLKVIYAPGVYPVICILYPIRKIFKERTSSLFQKAYVLMEQERIRRSCELQQLEK